MENAVVFNCRKLKMGKKISQGYFALVITILNLTIKANTSQITLMGDTVNKVHRMGLSLCWWPRNFYFGWQSSGGKRITTLYHSIFLMDMLAHLPCKLKVEHKGKKKKKKHFYAGFVTVQLFKKIRLCCCYRACTSFSWSGNTSWLPGKNEISVPELHL